MGKREGACDHSKPRREKYIGLIQIQMRKEVRIRKIKE